VLYHEIHPQALWKIDRDSFVLVKPPYVFADFPKETIYLVNSGNPAAEPNLDLYTDDKIAFTIFAAPPTKSHYKVFEGKYGITKLYMLCWEEDELRRLAAKLDYLEEEKICELYYKFDGIPKYVFSPSPDIITNSIDRIISTITTSDLLKYAGTDIVDPEVSHKIIKLVPEGLLLFRRPF
jgi:hypothetical protein